MSTPQDSTHAFGPGNGLAVFATPAEFGVAVANLLPCAGVERDGSNVTHAVVVIYTDDGYWHVAGDLAEAVMTDPLAFDYLRTLPAVARAIGSLDSLPGIPAFTADAPDMPDLGYTVPDVPYAGRHRKPGRIMRALGFRA